MLIRQFPIVSQSSRIRVLIGFDNPTSTLRPTTYAINMRFTSGRWRHRIMSFTSTIVAALCNALRARVSAVTQIGARELARRARTRTRILTLLRCSGVWCVDINAHGSLLRPGVHTRAGTRAWNRPRVFAVVIVSPSTAGWQRAGADSVAAAGRGGASVEIYGCILIKSRIIAHVAGRCANYISKERSFATYGRVNEARISRLLSFRPWKDFPVLLTRPAALKRRI